MSPNALHTLNFTHLRSFWATAQEGTVAAAARRLHLSQPTISEQVRDLERALGVELFEKNGRRWLPTAAGQLVLGYAATIFGLAEQMGEALAHGRSRTAIRLRVGVVETVPKRMVWRLLEPAVQLGQVVLECREDATDRLLADLAVHRLDLIISDTPLPAGSPIMGFNHPLGESVLAWFALPGVVPSGPWPQCLDRAKILLPTPGPMRVRIDAWLESAGITPEIVAEIQDTGLLKAAGGAGAGAFPAPLALARGLREEQGCELLGQVPAIAIRYYAISTERRLGNPAAEAICRSAGRQFEDLS